MRPILAKYQRQTTGWDTDHQTTGGENLRRIHYQKIQNTQQIGKH